MAGEFPKWNDNEIDLLKKIAANSAALADAEAGDVAQIVAGTGISVSPAGGTGVVTVSIAGSGIVTSVAGTLGNVLVNGAVAPATGAVTLSLPSDVYSVTSLGIGTGALVATAGVGLEVASTVTTSPRGIMSAQYNTGTDGARFHGRKARGTRAAPTTIVTGDNLTRWVGSGYDGSNYLEMASIIFGTEGTIAATRVPTNIQFQTGTNAAPSVLTTALTLNSSQQTLHTDGTAPLPSMSFASDPDTGFYHLSANRTGFASGGGLILDVGSTGLTFANGMAIDGGTGLTMSAISSITGTASGLGLLAGGTNQSITLTPSGTGDILGVWNSNTQRGFNATNSNAGTAARVGFFANASGATGIFQAYASTYTTSGINVADSVQVAAASDAAAGLYLGSNTTAPVVFFTNLTERARFSSGGNLLLGGLTTDGTGFLQFPVGTTSASGVTFGADVNFYRAAAGILTLSGTAGNGQLRIANTGTTIGTLQSFSGDFYVDSAGSLIFRTNGTTTALTIGTNQVVTSASDIVSNSKLGFLTSTWLTAPANGVLGIQNNAQTAGVSLDAATDAFLKVRNRANNADADLQSLSLTTTGATSLSSAAGGGLIWATRGDFFLLSDGVFRLRNNASTKGASLDVGTTDGTIKFRDRTNAADAPITAGAASFSGAITLTDVTLTRTGGTVLTVGAANGTNFTGPIIAGNGTAIPAGGTAGIGVMVSSTANFGVFFGSGAPTLSAAKGSLYLRSNGSTTNDRVYVNTDGGTTWTALTTVA